ncbi:hypothetical protein ACIQZB_33170 [Streptomyces sp. NPDC097727]|uniref:hypothetical protein n=1 Tax=Streptomyces sp. NPDC097727 TaxID=3366092 RepID=UPI0037F7516A
MAVLHRGGCGLYKSDLEYLTRDEAIITVYLAVSGGEHTLRELVHEFKTRGPVQRRTVRTTLKASYTNHY